MQTRVHLSRSIPSLSLGIVLFSIIFSVFLFLFGRQTARSVCLAFFVSQHRRVCAHSWHLFELQARVSCIPPFFCLLHPPTHTPVLANLQFHRCAKGGNLAGLALIVFSAAMASRDKSEPIWDKPWVFYVAVMHAPQFGGGGAVYMCARMRELLTLL